MDDLLEMWHAHAAIDLYLLRNLPEGGLQIVPAAGSVSVGQMFAHISDLRLRWIQHTAPALTEELPWFEQQTTLAPTLATLEVALERSAEAIAALIRLRGATGEGVLGFPGPLAAFLGYLISHESYHWGEIGLALSQAGLPLAPEVALGIWRGWWARVSE